MSEDVQGQDVVQEVEAKEPVQYFLDNGQECSRSAYIRQEFLKNKSRSEIAKELDVSYNIVFSATANMFNEKHPEGATGRGSGGRSVIVEDPRDGQMKPRAQVMKELYAEGQTRAEIAKQFDVAYATVYGATKDVEPPEGSKAARTGRVMITHPETGEKVARVDFIREQYALGKTRREIANMAGCDYTIVWMATKPVKEEGEEEAPTDAVESPDLELDTDPDLNY